MAMLASRSSRDGWVFEGGLDMVERQGMGGREKIGTVVRVVGGSEYQDDTDSEMVMANEGKS
jgi:hypothetical protein